MASFALKIMVAFALCVFRLLSLEPTNRPAVLASASVDTEHLDDAVVPAPAHADISVDTGRPRICVAPSGTLQVAAEAPTASKNAGVTASALRSIAAVHGELRLLRDTCSPLVPRWRVVKVQQARQVRALRPELAVNPTVHSARHHPPVWPNRRIAQGHIRRNMEKLPRARLKEGIVVRDLMAGKRTAEKEEHMDLLEEHDSSARANTGNVPVNPVVDERAHDAPEKEMKHDENMNNTLPEGGPRVAVEAPLPVLPPAPVAERAAEQVEAPADAQDGAEDAARSAAETDDLNEDDDRSSGFALALQPEIPEPPAAEMVPVAPSMLRPTDNRPVIHQRPGGYHVALAETQAALVNSGYPLFNRGNKLVEIQVTEGVCSVQPSNPARLKPIASVLARFIKHTDNKRQEVDPPSDLLNAVLANPNAFPRLKVLTDVPVMLPDGTVIDKRGYHEAGGVFYEPAPGLEKISIPEAPTREDAEAAMATLFEPLVDFPFADDVHFSAALAGLLAPIVRTAIEGPVPAVVVDACQPGSGKTQYAKNVASIAKGQPGPVKALRNDIEMEKRIATCVKQGTLIEILDNVHAVVGGAALEGALTAKTWAGRAMNKQEDICGQMVTCFFMTGNNIAVHNDMHRRILYVRLESPLERPERRDDWAHPNPDAWILANRPRFIAAGLTMCKAYFVAGKPDQHLEPLGGYEDWSGVVRSAIVWLGGMDPCRSTDGLHERLDPETEAYRTLLSIIAPEFGNESFTTKDILDLHDTSGFATDTAEALADAITTLTRTGAASSQLVKLSMVLRSRAGSVHGGKRLARDGKCNIGTKWRISTVGGKQA